MHQIVRYIDCPVLPSLQFLCNFWQFRLWQPRWTVWTCDWNCLNMRFCLRCLRSILKFLKIRSTVSCCFTAHALKCSQSRSTMYSELSATVTMCQAGVYSKKHIAPPLDLTAETICKTWSVLLPDLWQLWHSACSPFLFFLLLLYCLFHLLCIPVLRLPLLWVPPPVLLLQMTTTTTTATGISSATSATPTATAQLLIYNCWCLYLFLLAEVCGIFRVLGLEITLLVSTVCFRTFLFCLLLNLP